MSKTSKWSYYGENYCENKISDVVADFKDRAEKYGYDPDSVVAENITVEIEYGYYGETDIMFYCEVTKK
jgi:hypothetical protein